MSKPVRPEDVLADGVDSAQLGGREVRKGSVAAFVANAQRLDTLEPGSAAYEAVAGQLRELVPALRAVGVLEVFRPASPRIAQLVARA